MLYSTLGMQKGHNFLEVFQNKLICKKAVSKEWCKKSSLSGCAGWFESYLVGNPKDLFSQNKVDITITHLCNQYTEIFNGCENCDF